VINTNRWVFKKRKKGQRFSIGSKLGPRRNNNITLYTTELYTIDGCTLKKRKKERKKRLV